MKSEGNVNPFIIFVKYLTGFGNEFASEALPDALPVGQVSLRQKISAFHNSLKQVIEVLGLRLLYKIETMLIDFGI